MYHINPLQFYTKHVFMYECMKAKNQSAPIAFDNCNIVRNAHSNAFILGYLKKNPARLQIRKSHSVVTPILKLVVKWRTMI
jgi:hypothetical protein